MGSAWAGGTSEGLMPMGMDLFPESQDWQIFLSSDEPSRSRTLSQYHASISGTQCPGISWGQLASQCNVCFALSARRHSPETGHRNWPTGPMALEGSPQDVRNLLRRTHSRVFHRDTWPCRRRNHVPSLRTPWSIGVSSDHDHSTAICIPCARQRARRRISVLQTTIRDCRLESLDLSYSQRSKRRELHESFITSACRTGIVNEFRFLALDVTAGAGTDWVERRFGQCDRRVLVPCPHSGEFTAQILSPQLESPIARPNKLGRAVFDWQSTTCVFVATIDAGSKHNRKRSSHGRSF